MPTPGKTDKKAWVLIPLVSVGSSNHARPRPCEGTFTLVLPLRQPPLNPKMSSFSVSSSRITSNLKPSLLFPESFFVSDKPFHAVWVHVWHQQFQNPNQILGGVHLTSARVTTTIWYIRVGCMKLRLWRCNEVQGEMWQWQLNSWVMWNMVLEESRWECHKDYLFCSKT